MTAENLLINRDRNKPAPLAPITIEYGNEYVFENLSTDSQNATFTRNGNPVIQKANYENEIEPTKWIPLAACSIEQGVSYYLFKGTTKPILPLKPKHLLTVSRDSPIIQGPAILGPRLTL